MLGNCHPMDASFPLIIAILYLADWRQRSFGWKFRMAQHEYVYPPHLVLLRLFAHSEATAATASPSQPGSIPGVFWGSCDADRAVEC